MLNTYVSKFPKKYKPDPQQVVLLDKLEESFKTDKKFVICCAPTGSGKAQPLYSSIRSPVGWIKMGDIKVGDEICTPSGGNCNVTHVHPQGTKQIYLVKFNDGRTTECCENHLWKIQSHNFSKKWKICKTTDLKEYLKSTAHIHIPLPKPIQYPESVLPIDPYIVGALLGDGGLTTETVSFTNKDEFIINKIKSKLNSDYVLSPINNSIFGYTIIQRKRSNKPFKKHTEYIGIHYTKSDTKHIPQIYKNSSIEQRKELMRGILDTDGYVGKSGSIAITLTSYNLINDIKEIIQSLGGIAKIIREYIPVCTKPTGEKINGKKAYTLSIRYPEPSDILSLPSKQQRCPKKYQYSNLKLQVQEVVKLDKYTECQCITIDSKDQLYITDEYIVTHNSLIARTFGNITTECSDEFRELINSYDAFRMEYTGEYTYAPDCLMEDPFGAFVLTITKSLQDQYQTLFEESPILKGKSNYTCQVDTNFDVDTAPCMLTPKLKDECWKNNTCPYYNARNKLLTDQFGILNYKMFLSLPEHVKKKEFIICDEASELEDTLVNQFSVTIDPDKLKVAGVKVNSLYSTEYEAVQQWLASLAVVITEEADFILSKIFSKKIDKASQTDRIKLSYLRSIHNSIKMILETWHECEYVIQREENKVKLTPLKVDCLSKHIFDHADKVLLMSATIIDPANFAKTLGIKDFTYVEAENTFDPKKAPIHFNTTNKLNFANLKSNLPKIAKQIQAICELHKGDKGVIHTHSMAITRSLQSNLKGNRFLFRDEGQKNEAIIRAHTESAEPTVIVSPSVVFGVDLKDDLARFQIVVKAGYPPLGDARIKRLFELDKQWYADKMLSTFVQSCGRGVRSKDDHCVTYVLDACIYEAIKKNKANLPKHFLERFV